jgi:tripartite-type tricarboxylate transporter receptor subunit TctC
MTFRSEKSGAAVNAPRRGFLQGAAGALWLSALPGLARAETYPSRPITLVVPFPAGGPVDTLARFLGEHMRTPLGQPLVIENVSGAAGSIGVGRVARAVPDGYTLIIGITSTHVFNGAMYSLQYDVLNDFEPVALLTDSSQVIVGKKSLPPNTLRELIAWLKANPDKATSGSAGVGSPHHIFGVLFQNATGTRFQFAHYRGAAPAARDLVAGQVDLAIADLVTSLPQIRAGNIKVYAFTGKRRLPSLPDVPTAEEAGLPGFHTSIWNAIWAPKGTPKPIIATLNAAVVAALGDPAARARLAELGHYAVARESQSAEALRALHQAEIEKWWPIIKAAHIRVD